MLNIMIKLKKIGVDDSVESSEYHHIYIEGEVVVPFYKLEMLGKTIEFPYNCQGVVVCENLETEDYELSTAEKVENYFKDSLNNYFISV